MHDGAIRVTSNARQAPEPWGQKRAIGPRNFQKHFEKANKFFNLSDTTKSLIARGCIY